MTKCKILLIDCLNDINEWLTQTFTMLKENWPVVVANNLDDALLYISNTQFDVVIMNLDVSSSSIQEDIQLIKNKNQDCIIVLLLSENDNESYIKSINLVHRIYSKPIQAEAFYQDLDSLINLKYKISQSKNNKKLVSINTLPSPPQTFTEIISELNSIEPSISKISNIIKRDIGLTTKLLQLINSAYYGLKSKVHNPSIAINLLGLETVKNLALTLSSFNQFSKAQIDDYTVQNILNYSLDIGKASKTYATVLGLNNSMIESASLAGMLHDIGKLAMISILPDEFKKSLRFSKDNMISLYQAQKETVGLTDAEIGGYLLFLWGLPECIVNAVTYHYLPSENKNTNIDIVTAVHLAYAIENETKQSQITNNALDMNYISTLQLDNELSKLRSFAVACQV